MRITPEDTEHVGIYRWGIEGEGVGVEYKLQRWDRRAPRVLEYPKIVRYMGKQRKVTEVTIWIEPDWIDQGFLSESKRIKLRVPEGVKVDLYTDEEKYFDIETY